MTAAKAYRESSVTWKGAAVPGIMDVSENETHEGVTKHRTDNVTTTQAVFIDGVGATIEVTSTDISLRGTSGYTLGANGILVVVAEQRAEAVGAVAASSKTHTYADASLIGIRNGLPINGKGSLVLTFETADPTGAAVCAFS